MADHAQDQILDYFSALLVAAGTAAGTAVEIDRVDSIPLAKLPHLHLQAENEDKPWERGSIGYPRTCSRFFAWSLTATVTQASGYGKAARTLAMQAEKAICATRSTQQAGGVAGLGTHLQRTEFFKDGNGDKPAYAVVQHWVSGYQARDNAPDEPL